MQDLTVTLIQADVFWEDINSNLSAFDARIDSIRDETDLIILSEMFTTGFSMNAEFLAQDMNGESVNWLKNKSRSRHADIAGSMIIRDGGRYLNRLFWAKPDGRLFYYDKRHLFRMTGEDKIYSPGNENITIEIDGWKIRPFVCYDLRFPCWTRNFNNCYDVAVFIASWPEKRSYHWKALLTARAIENQCYVIGVNRIGEDGNGYRHSGDSSAVDFAGRILFQKQNEEAVFSVSLSHSALDEYRKSFPAWMDADHYEYTS